MPTREPTYYRWSQEKPCTTNQTYGYELRLQSGTSSTGCCNSTNGRTQNTNKSNGEVCTSTRSMQSQSAGATASQRQRESKPQSASSETACKAINKGYVFGYVPVTKKMPKDRGMSGVMLKRTASSPSPHSPHQPKGNSLYLWHALSGTLVHCTNYDSPGDE